MNAKTLLLAGCLAAASVAAVAAEAPQQQDAPAASAQSLLSIEQAVAKVLEQYPGAQVYEAELEHKLGRTYWEFELVDASRRRVDVYVDARTGEILTKRSILGL